MKKLILLALVLFSAATMLAQTNRMSYQAVVRNAANELVAEENLTVAIRISDANGTSAFSETHSVTSNRNGVISLMIGEGSGQSGNIMSVDWRTAQIHTEVTLPGGATLTNTTPVNAVPYAFYADSVDIHWVNDVVDEYLENHDISSIVETDPTVPAWAKEATKPVYDYSEITNTPTIPTNVGELTNDANYITLEQVPAQVNADWNATEGAAQILNKPELFSGDYNDLTNKPTIPTTVGELTNDANYITLEQVPAQVNADWNATEGAAQILNKPELFSGDYNDLTNTPTIPTVPTNVGAFTNDAGYITAEEVPAVSVPTNVSAFNNDAQYVTTNQLNAANYITAADVPAQVNADWNATEGAAQILNKPELFSGDYNDLTNTPTIPTVPANVSEFNNDAEYVTTNQLNAANYITAADVPAQVNADWNATEGAAQILNKPELFSGDYNDLTNTPTIPTVPTNVGAFTNDAGYITAAEVPAVSVPTNVSAFDNDAEYVTTNQLNAANYITAADVPAQVNADWNATEGAAQILNKPELFSGDYNDLTNTPTIPTVPANVSEFNNDAEYVTTNQLNAANYITAADVPAQVNADWNATTGAAQILNKPELFSGDYNDLTNKPTIPTVPTNVSEFNNDAEYVTTNQLNAANYITAADVPAQVNADWNATEGAAQILNKPELFSGDYNDLTNTPTIPTVPANVSEFNNDAEYVTTNQLNAANYITAADVPAQVNADWNATEGAAQILNKPELFSGDYNDLTNTPTIPTVPTNVGAFTNDAGYITAEDIPALSSVPTNVSAFDNDANYITNSNNSCANSVDLCELLEKLQQLESQLEFQIFTQGVTAVTQNSFTVNGKVQTDGSTTVSQRGFVYSSSNPTPSISDYRVNCGSGTGTYSYTVTGLTPGITYYVRAYATNENGTFYGSVVAVTTTATSPSTLPSVTTIAVTDVGKFRATVSGSVTSDGGENVTQRGFVYGTSSNPTTSNSVVTSGSGTGDYTILLSNLQAGTLYYVRAFAVNSKGTAYGNQLTFNTTADEQPASVENDGQPCPGTPTVTDHEGNVYNTVQIGTQCWTKENMRATTSPTTGTYLITPAGITYTYSGKQARWYNNDSATYAPQNYGLLYNWNAAVDTFNTTYGETSLIPFASDHLATYYVYVNFSGHRRGICPQGWHVPSHAEWTTLTNYLGSHENYYYYDDESYDVPVTNTNYIAKALASTQGWYNSTNTFAVGNNQGTNNATGFSAVPAGRWYGSSFDLAGRGAYYWTSTQYYSYYAYYRYLDYSNAYVGWQDYGDKGNGCSVRCLRDNDVPPTSQTQPTVTTSAATNITSTSATLNGSVSNPDGVTITAQGFEWKATTGGTYALVTATGSTGSTMSYALTGLTAGTSYTYCAFVTTAEGTSYGSEVDFTTTAAGGGTVEGDAIPCPGTPTVTDHEGNVYNTVQIGTQCWTKENIRTTTSPSTGTYLILPAGTTYTSTGKQARWLYNDSATYAPMNYGLLYNWNAAVDTFNTDYGETSVIGDDSKTVSVSFTGNRRGICPEGWHLPSDAEWMQLTDYVSSQSEYVCGGNTNYITKALASGMGWTSSTNTCAVGNNQGTYNASGFSAVPAGYCGEQGFNFAGDDTYFWSSTQNHNHYESYDYAAWCRQLYYDSADVGRGHMNKIDGMSVRCLRD